MTIDGRLSSSKESGSWFLERSYLPIFEEDQATSKEDRNLCTLTLRVSIFKARNLSTVFFQYGQKSLVTCREHELTREGKRISSLVPMPNRTKPSHQRIHPC